MSKPPHFGDRPVSGWRYDPSERDVLSFTLGVARRARRPKAKKPASAKPEAARVSLPEKGRP